MKLQEHIEKGSPHDGKQSADLISGLKVGLLPVPDAPTLQQKKTTAETVTDFLMMPDTPSAEESKEGTPVGDKYSPPLIGGL